MKKLSSLLRRHSSPTVLAERIDQPLLQQIHQRLPLKEIKYTFPKPSKSPTPTEESLSSSPQTFQIENWLHTGDVCVGRWVAPLSNGYNMPEGSYSWGVWRKDLSVGTYRLHDSYGNLLAYRFDVVKDVEMKKENQWESVQYFDLVVDLWVWPTPSGEIITTETEVEDLEELVQLQDNGIISDSDSRGIEQTVGEIIFEPQRIVKIVDETIREALDITRRASYYD